MCFYLAGIEETYKFHSDRSPWQEGTGRKPHDQLVTETLEAQVREISIIRLVTQAGMHGQR